MFLQVNRLIFFFFGAVHKLCHPFLEIFDPSLPLVTHFTKYLGLWSNVTFWQITPHTKVGDVIVIHGWPFGKILGFFWIFSFCRRILETKWLEELCHQSSVQDCFGRCQWRQLLHCNHCFDAKIIIRIKIVPFRISNLPNPR